MDHRSGVEDFIPLPQPHIMSLDSKALAIGAAVGVLLTLGLSHILPCPFPLKRNSKRAFALAVRLRIKEGTLELFKEKWGVLAKHCRSSEEPNCLSYELCTEKDDPHSLLIYERYVAESDLTGTHNASVPFKAFGKWLNEISGIVVEGSKSKAFYHEVSCWADLHKASPTFSMLLDSSNFVPFLSSPSHLTSLSFLLSLLSSKLSFSDQCWAHGKINNGNKNKGMFISRPYCCN